MVPLSESPAFKSRKNATQVGNVKSNTDHKLQRAYSSENAEPRVSCSLGFPAGISSLPAINNPEESPPGFS